jgi:hypothetical protein
MKQNRKAQSALEFLTTYGWAFLVILIMIGALAYFGILNPTRYLPDRCSIQAGFDCNDFNVVRVGDSEFSVELALGNFLQNPITVSGITMDSVDFPASVEDADCWNAADVTIPVGESVLIANPAECRIIIGTDTLPAAGSKTKVEGTITYLEQGSLITKTLNFEILASLS